MNKQKPSPLINTESGVTLQVHSIFHTIQGEGPFAGERAVFVRLAGCNLRCPGCDTEYTEGAQSLPFGPVVDRINELFWGNGEPTQSANTQQNRKLVVITGGEPFRQNITPFVKRLVSCGYRVQIETNGSIAPTNDFMEMFHHVAGVTVVCAPKGQVHESIWGICRDVKYVVDHMSVAADGLPTSVLGLKVKEVSRPPSYWRGTIYVQPMDGGASSYENVLNTETAVKSVMQHGYKLCLQMHKIVNVE